MPCIQAKMMIMTNFQELYDFIDRATRSRKYPEATAQTLKAALKLYDPELNDEERTSVEKFKENFEQITRSVFGKNASRFSASSLATYKSRAQKVLADFDKYSDPLKMNSWSPKVIMRNKKAVSAALPPPKNTFVGASEKDEPLPDNMHKIELALRENAKVIIIIPRDLKAQESATIKAILDSLVVQ